MKERLNQWACTHRRTGGFAGYPTGELYELCAARMITPAEVAAEFMERDLECPGCRNQARRHRAHWSALILAIVLALLVICAAVGR
jgi:hypothetical protein